MECYAECPSVARLLSILLLTLFAVLLISPSSTFAQVPEDLIPPDVPEQEIRRVQTEGSPLELYSLYFGVTQDEAKRRLDLQADSERIYDAVSLEPSFAGGWIEHTPVFQQVFAVTDPEAIERVIKTVSALEWNGGLTVPLDSFGFVNWGNIAWQAFPPATPPRAQEEFIIGNFAIQRVFWQDNSCTQYKYPLDDLGNRKYPDGIITSCPTLIPGSGDIQSYTAWVVNDQLREGMWRNNKGYTRILQLNSAKTGAIGETTVQWTECCTGTGPHAQGVYILNHP